MPWARYVYLIANGSIYVDDGICSTDEVRGGISFRWLNELSTVFPIMYDSEEKSASM